MTNDANDVAGNGKSHYSSITATSTQLPFSQMMSDTVYTANTSGIMDETASTPPPLAADQECTLPPTKHDEQKLNSGNCTNRELTVSKDISSSEPATTVFEAPEEVMVPSPKRPREEDDNDKDTLRAPKRPVTEADTEVGAYAQSQQVGGNPPQKTTAIDNENGTDEVAGPEKRKRGAKAKPEKKPPVKSRRGLACAECKRRKVKCKHNTGTEEAGDDVNTSKQLGFSKGKHKLPTTTRALQTDEGAEPVPSEAQASNQTLKDADHVDDAAAPNGSNLPMQNSTKKKGAPKKARAPPERISARDRRAPERFEDLQEQRTTKTLPTKKGSSKVFDPVYITTNSTSRLGKADLYHMLTNDDSAWTSLSAEQQASLVSMLPDTADTQQSLIRIRAGETKNTRPQYLKASDVFRTEIAKFQADLTNGHLAKTWQATSKQAVSERASGEYDAWKAEEAELWWGQKSK